MFTRPGNATYNPPPAVTNNTPTVDPGIHSIADLLNVSTVNLVPPIIKVWVNYADGTSQIWTLLGIAGGQQPADYNALTPKTWFKSSS